LGLKVFQLSANCAYKRSETGEAIRIHRVPD
jgi:hypothetical protein